MTRQSREPVKPIYVHVYAQANTVSQRVAAGLMTHSSSLVCIYPTSVATDFVASHTCTHTK